MPNSIDYTTISIQPPKGTICTNQSGGLILRPSKTVDEQSNNEVRRDESEQDPGDDPIQLASSAATKSNNNAQAAAGDAAGTTWWSQYVYRECQKNHAASMGRYVVDGCGEFMPSGEEGSAQALKCAACQCHRSFHRRDIQEVDYSQQLFKTIIPPPVIMAFGGPTDSSSEDLKTFGDGEKTTRDEAPFSKKRFRTKFSKEQRVRMQQLAAELGWKIQNKEDEERVEHVCNELGVKRSVFKVWMHNNKQKQHHNKLDR